MLNNLFKKESGPVFCVKLAALALIVRFCIAAAYYNFFVLYLRRPLYALDGEAYSIMGCYIALVLKGVNLSILPSAFISQDYSIIGGLLGTIVNFKGFLPPMINYGVGVYAYFIGWFYHIFGYAPVLLRFFMGAISVLTALLAYVTARDVFDEYTARISYVFALFMPSFVLYSASLQRDTFINFFTMLIMSQALIIKKGVGIKRLAVAIAIIVLSLKILALLRPNAMLVLSVFLACYIFIRLAFSYKWTMATIVVSLLAFKPIADKLALFVKAKFAIMFNYHIGLNYLGGFTYRLLPESYYNFMDVCNPTSTYSMPFPVLITSCLKGIYVFFIEPSPFSLNKLQQVFILPQMVVWYFLVAFVAAGIYFCMRSLTVERLSLIVALVLFGVTLGISESNYETLLRHRDMIVPVFIMIAAYGMKELGRLKIDKKA